MRVIRTVLGKWLRRLLERQGWVLIRPNLRFGIDPFVDVAVLSDRWNYTIKTIFDVGANEGQTAAKALKCFPRAKVISFEPHPATFARLVSRVGSLPRFTAVNLALGNEVKNDVQMFEYDGSLLNSLIPNAPYPQKFAYRSRCIFVKCTTLDTFCSERGIDEIDLLKVDTEGFDLFVLKGAAAMIEARAIRFVYVEFNDLQKGGDDLGEALLPIDDLLRPHGYRFIATYVDNILTDGKMIAISNALFALPPRHADNLEGTSA